VGRVGLLGALLSLLACSVPQGSSSTAPQAEVSVKPGINTDFLDPAADVAKWVERFETESREVFEQRQRVVGVLAPKAGMAVADVGAGTGFLSAMISRHVGTNGKVYAVELAPAFVRHLIGVRRRLGLENLVVVRCTERSVELPRDSIDLAFVCDTYHHFEYPRSTLASIYHALRRGGELVVLDFIRVPGVSREWILDHVRAGQEVVSAEIEQAGFRKVRDEETPFLKENYMMRFAKP
jgi:predicted methyltransferase